MTWVAPDRTLPLASNDGPTAVANVRNNYNALYFLMIASGVALPGFTVTTNPSPSSSPTELRYRKGPASTAGSIWLRVTYVYTSGLVTKETREISEDGGTTYQPMAGEDGNHIANHSYSSGVYTGTTWSNT